MEEVVGSLSWNNAMLVSGIILAATFVGIFTEAVHGFHRTKFAMGGNGTHLGSTANVFIVTISERLARETGEMRYRITPGLWFRKGTPVMIITLITSSVIFWAFFDFYANPLPSYQ